MRKGYFAATAAALGLAVTPAFAASRAPVKLTEQQLDQVTAGKKYNFTFYFVVEDATLYESPINTALVFQINGSGTAYQYGTATAVQSVLDAGAASAQAAHPMPPSHASRPAHAGR